MKFRPYPPSQPKKADIIKLTLLPRSIYVFAGRRDGLGNIASRPPNASGIRLRSGPQYENPVHKQ